MRMKEQQEREKEMLLIETGYTGMYENTDESKKKEYEDVINRVLSSAENMLDEGKYSVYIELTDNTFIHSVNKEFRNTDCPTDVLSFPQYDFYDGEGYVDDEGLDPENDSALLGDIIISLDKVKEQSLDYGHSFERELAFLSVHGFLHLLGFDHESKEREEKMYGTAEMILNNAGYTR